MAICSLLFHECLEKDDRNNSVSERFFRFMISPKALLRRCFFGTQLALYKKEKDDERILEHDTGDIYRTGGMAGVLPRRV